MTELMKSRIYSAGISACCTIYLACAIGIATQLGFAYSDTGAGSSTTTVSEGNGQVTTTSKTQNGVPWDDLRKNVADNAVITFFSFLVISALIGLLLYFARSKSTLQNQLVDVISKNTIVLQLLQDKLTNHPCLILDSVHRDVVLDAIKEQSKEKPQ
jgi:hypothetical protein